MKILVVDDNASLARALKTFLLQESHQAEIAHSVKEAQTFISKNNFDLIITDLRLPDGDGLQIIQQVRNDEAVPAPDIIMMTAFGSVDSAVEAMRLGIADYLTKPVAMEEFSFRIRRIEEYRKLGAARDKLEKQRQSLLGAAGLDLSLDDIVGSSPPILEVKNLISRVAPYLSTVLITGETGVGKEMVAKAVHQLSPRVDGPFVRVNCASIPENLFEAELFGHEKGAFTDARQKRLGSFEIADGGTLFLDEVGEIPMNLQAKLLRVLQEKEITRLGSSRPLQIDVRIVAATNRNLENMVADGLFREDLLYRLSVVKIDVPPLRQRAGDFSLICQSLLDRIGKELGKGPLRINETSLVKLAQLQWPGNIRQLKNALERAAVMSDHSMLDFAAFDHKDYSISGSPVQKAIDDAGKPAPAIDRFDAGLVAALEGLERQMITQALEKSGGIKSRAAEILMIPRTQLLYRMKRLGLESEDF